jgi:hypothetical protein
LTEKKKLSTSSDRTPTYGHASSLVEEQKDRLAASSDHETNTEHRLEIKNEYKICVIILDPLHQVSYSFHDPHCCTPYRTCHLHITRQANTILQTK